ncbi:MAG TPA: VWA domain-containing protein [Pyrinomonadaceae bacterium]|nr:VWA domain-containing protein [Pyrinomonadaceae bacterium]
MRCIGHNLIRRSKAIFWTIAICGLLPVISAAQSGRIQPTPTPEDVPIRIVTEEIKLNVLAFDEDGKFFADISERDLVITENNVLHQPTSVRRVPANVLIVMDNGGELRSAKNLDRTRKVAAALVMSLRPEDSVAIIQYSDKAEVVAEWTTDKAEAISAIGKTKFGRRSALVKGLEMARNLLTKSGFDNKHLVLISDGTDSFVNSSAKQRAFRTLLAGDFSVHVLSYTRMEMNEIEPRTKSISKTPPPRAMPDEVVAGLPNGVRQTAQAPKIGPTVNVDREFLRLMRNRKADLEFSEEQLLELTANTNGEMIIPLDIEEMIEKTALVARMIDSSYVVTYTPKIPFDEVAGERDIWVTSKREGLIVDSRRKVVIERSRR